MATPLRRDDNLVPLSHDHHTALARARDVQLGLDGTVPVEPAVLAATMTAFFSDHLALHFALEESLLVPPLADRVGADHPLLEQMRAEHLKLRALSEGLVNGGEGLDPTLPGRLTAWREALSGHVRFEERQLFPLVQEHLDEAQLAAIGRALADHGPACPA
ncbi:MAG: hemerythrin domain-containing protein [Leptospirillia bacterium]